MVFISFFLYNFPLLIIVLGVFMISTAFAQSAAGGAGGFSLQGLLPFVLIFIIFYFLLIRPQQKRVKQHKLMVESLKRGNKVLTAGGILGVVTKAVDGSETISVEISQGVTVELARQMISEVRGCLLYTSPSTRE